MKNWKTSLCGIISGLAALVIASPELFKQWPWALPLAHVVVALGIGGMGLVAKDGSNHSTQAQVNAASAQPGQAQVDSGPSTPKN